MGEMSAEGLRTHGAAAPHLTGMRFPQYMRNQFVPTAYRQFFMWQP